MINVVLDVANADAIKVHTSSSYARKHTPKVMQSLAAKIHADWIPPTKCVLHFDGKHMRKIGGTENEERLAVVISGPFGEKF